MSCENGRDPTDVEDEENVNKPVQNEVDNLVPLSSNQNVDADYDPEEDEDEDEDPDYKPTEKEKEEAEKERNIDWRIELNDALECVRERARFDSGILAERISETFCELNGVEPTLNQLTEIFTNIKTEFLEENEVDNTTLKEYVERLATSLVNNAFERSETLKLKMLKTPVIKSKTGIAEAYDVYFSQFDKKREGKNLLAAIESFKMRNQREPTQFDINRLKSFLSTNDETSPVEFKLVVDGKCAVDEKEKEIEEEKTATTKVLATQIETKKNAAKFNVYFANEKLDQNRNEKQAIKWFKIFNNREPTSVDLNLIKAFVKFDEKELIEYEYPVPAVASSDDIKEANYEIDGVVEKQLSTKYILNFEDSQKGNREEAIKWFKRFNNREPSQDEKQNITQFVEMDDAKDPEPEIIDID